MKTKATFLIIVFVAFFLFLFKDIIIALLFFPHFTNEAELTGPDGYTYSFMDLSMGQARSIKLVREKNGEADSYEELGETFSELLGWPVIRPAGADDEDYGQLYLSPKNQIVGIRYTYYCCFIYDTAKGEFHGYNDEKQVSPFILIAVDTKLHEPDVLGTMLELVKKYGSKAKHYPGHSGSFSSPNTLRDGLKHPNKEVIKLSKWMIAIQENGLSPSVAELHKFMDYIIELLVNDNIILRSYAVQIAGYMQSPYSQKAIPLLEKALYGEINNSSLKHNIHITSEAAESLGMIGKEAFPVLYKCLESKDSSLRFYGLLGFRRAGTAAKSEIPKLKTFLNDPVENVRKQASLAIEAIKYSY